MSYRLCLLPACSWLTWLLKQQEERRIRALPDKKQRKSPLPVITPGQKAPENAPANRSHSLFRVEKQGEGAATGYTGKNYSNKLCFFPFSGGFPGGF